MLEERRTAMTDQPEPTDAKLAEWLRSLDEFGDEALTALGIEIVFEQFPDTIRALQAARARIAELERDWVDKATAWDVCVDARKDERAPLLARIAELEAALKEVGHG